MATRFVGRQAELALLRSRLAAARAGQPAIVQVQGEPGIGKTALIDHFLDETEDVRVLRVSGDETETLLAYGVVEQLVRAAGQSGTALLEDHPVLSAPTVENHVTVGSRILDLLDTLQDNGPVVLVVDDAHWADLPSLQALIFALRRLVADSLLALIVVRDVAVPRLPESLRRLVTGYLGSTVRLSGLDDQELRELAEEMGQEKLSTQAARRLHRGTKGNPLHARALLEEFPAGTWGRGRKDLPSPRSFRLLVEDRLASCNPDTRRLVDAAAVLGMSCLLATASRLDDVADPLRALDEASKAQLVRPVETTQPGIICFTHPLVRAAVEDALGPVRRARLHTEAAALAESQTGVLRHRVAAASDTDAALAADLAAFAAREAGRQAWPSAAAHLVEASRLSPDRADREQRLLRAVNWMLFAGDAAQAVTFADEIATFDGHPLRDSVLGYLAMATREPAAAEGLLLRAWEQCGPAVDPELAATIALMNTVHYCGRLDGPAAVQWGRRALALFPSDSSTRPMVETYYSYGLGYCGLTEDAFAAVDGAELRPDEPEHSWLQPRSARGVLRLVEDDLAGARADLQSVASTAAELGILNTSAFSFAFLARTEYVMGDWDAAVLHAERAMAINAESDFTFTHSMVLAIAALVPAARGDWSTAEAFIRAATPPRIGYERAIVATAIAQACLAAAQGDAPGALAALEPVRRFPHRDGVDEPGFWPWQDLYAEALVATGRVDEADEFLAPHEVLAQRRRRLSTVAGLARARGRIEAAAGRPEPAEAAFSRGLAAIKEVRAPFGQALLELAYGQFLRRGGRRRAAADLLTAARQRFGDLGAEPWLDRCARELAACGLAPSRHRERDRMRLTSQELVVARLAGVGRTNRELAGELVVSVKTIEFHLRNVYQKLGVTSRKQLAARLAEFLQP